MAVPNPDSMNFFPSPYSQLDNENQPSFNNNNFSQNSTLNYRRPGGTDNSAPPSFSSSSDGKLYDSYGYETSNFDDEPPLLEELGIDFQHIKEKTTAVLNPFDKPDSHIMDDSDLSGPLVFCLLLGFFLLLAGKVHFGYIYGIGTVGCISMFCLLNLLSENEVNIWRTTSVLGYCLLPMVLLASFSLFFSLNSVLGYVCAGLIILWCTHSASLMFVSGLSLIEQRYLIMYPVGLLYTCFALMTMF